MGEPFNTARQQERAVLIGIITAEQGEETVKEYLNELAFLTETAGAEPVKTFTQKLLHPNPATFIGSGKLDEILLYVKENDIDLLIFDDELSPTQLRNLEKAFKRKILDRTNLILDIFASRARTSYAKTQVELAQCEYLLPRLAGLWTHLERQKGGIGLRGPGETEIETDRRIVRDKISLLKEHLKKIDRQMTTQRKNRGKMVRVALVGYTNVGKSTIMNLLSKSDVFAENKLFATLDTTVRKVVIQNLPFLLSDTVGHSLVESFKSTLDEVREADILIHVIDISHPNYEEQMEVVQKTIQEIGAAEILTFNVFNKIDAFKYTPKEEDDLSPISKENYNLEYLNQLWVSKEKKSVFISAKEKQNVDALKDLLYMDIKEIHRKRYPYDKFLY